jgi:hypothetical protein
VTNGGRVPSWDHVMKYLAPRIVATITLCATACSSIVVRQVPEDWNGIERPRCTSSYASTAADVLLTGVSAALVYHSQTVESENDVAIEESLWIMVLPAALFAVSALYGGISTRYCRQALATSRAKHR